MTFALRIGSRICPLGRRTRWPNSGAYNEKSLDFGTPFSESGTTLPDSQTRTTSLSMIVKVGFQMIVHPRVLIMGGLVRLIADVQRQQAGPPKCNESAAIP